MGRLREPLVVLVAVAIVIALSASKPVAHDYLEITFEQVALGHHRPFWCLRMDGTAEPPILIAYEIGFDDVRGKTVHSTIPRAEFDRMLNEMQALGLAEWHQFQYVGPHWDPCFWVETSLPLPEDADYDAARFEATGKRLLEWCDDEPNVQAIKDKLALDCPLWFGGLSRCVDDEALDELEASYQTPPQ